MDARDLGRLRIVVGRGGTVRVRDKEIARNFDPLKKAGLVTVEREGRRITSWVVNVTSDGRKAAK